MKRECEVTKTVNLALVIMQYEDVSVYMTHYSCQFLYTKGSKRLSGVLHMDLVLQQLAMKDFVSY